MQMKLNLTLLTCFIVFATAFEKSYANITIVDDNENVDDKEKKDEINGGVVHIETKKPLTNVSVTAFLTANKKEKTVVSDGNGNYAFSDLKPGTYKFVFEKDGYKKVTKEKIIIKTDDGFQLNIEMAEEKDFDFMPGAFNF
jgi:hypothetical protein